MGEELACLAGSPPWVDHVPGMEIALQGDPSSSWVQRDKSAGCRFSQKILTEAGAFDETFRMVAFFGLGRVINL